MTKFISSLSATLFERIQSVPGLSLVLGVLIVLATALLSDWTKSGRQLSMVLLLLNVFLVISVWLTLHLLTKNTVEREKLARRFEALDKRFEDFRDANVLLGQLTNLRATPGVRTIAEGELKLFGERLQGMHNGRFRKFVSLPSEQISDLFVPLMEDLIPRRGTWRTISVPSFWHENNVGSDKGFIEANARAARAGVEIERVLVLRHPPGEVPEWQKRVLRVLFFEMRKNQSRIRLKVLSCSDELSPIPNFAIWDDSLVVNMHYTSFEGDESRQFKEIEVLTGSRKLDEFRHTFDRWDNCNVLEVSDVTEQAERLFGDE